MSKKICILTSVHSPFDTRVFYREAKSLIEAGYDVTLVAQNNRDEVIEGVKILALPSSRNRIFRMLGVWRAFRLTYRQKADVYHFHDPELLPVGLVLKLLTKAKVIYDVHEDFPDQILSKYWLPLVSRRFVAFVFNVVEKSMFRWLDYIVVATDVIALKFKKGKVVTVQNFPILNSIEPKSNYEFRNPSVIYAGTLEEEFGITEIVQAMQYVDTSKNLKLILCGKFSQKSYETQVRKLHGFEKVEYMGWLKPQELWLKMAQATVAIICYHPSPNFVASQPRKLFEYMAVGLPIIASNFPLWKGFVEGNKCGLTVNPLDAREIATAIEYLTSHPDEARRMGENSRKATLEKYNWENESKKLLSIYEELLGMRSRSGEVLGTQ